MGCLSEALNAIADYVSNVAGSPLTDSWEKKNQIAGGLFWGPAFAETMGAQQLLAPKKKAYGKKTLESVNAP